jgi:biotin carboxyl carrier protein
LPPLDAVSPTPAQLEPAAPAKPEPAAPAKPEPAASAKPEPAAPGKPEPAAPAKPEPAAPEQVTAEPAAPVPDLAKPAPVIAHVSASAAGQVTAFLRARRAVNKGEVLFQITRVVGDPTQISALGAKVDELTKLAAQDPMYEPFLASAKEKLSGARRVVATSISAPRAGDATPHVHQGQMVSAGQLLADVAYVASAPGPSARKK